MAATAAMAGNIQNWMSKNSGTVSGYVAGSGVLAGIVPAQITTKLATIVSTLTSINIVIAFLIGLVTLGVKLMEFIAAWRKRKQEEKDETA